MHAFTIRELSFLIVTLSNGYVLCFNLYPNALKSAANSADVQIVRLSQVFKCGNIVDNVSMPHPDAILLTSDSESFMLTVDTSPKSNNFNDLLVIPIRQRANQLLMMEGSSQYAIMVGDLDEDSSK